MPYLIGVHSSLLTVSVSCFSVYLIFLCNLLNRQSFDTAFLSRSVSVIFLYQHGLISSQLESWICHPANNYIICFFLHAG